jgi:hypothetical protein
MRFGRISGTLVLGAVFTLALAGIASGSDGQGLILGHDNSADHTTSINAAGATVGPPPAGAGFWADGNIGVFGSTTGFDTAPPDELIGVVGIGSDQGGYFTGVDRGLTAISAGDGPDIEARGATAISADGNVEFSSAGLATIAKGKTSVTVTPGVGISPSSKVRATLQSAGGTFQRARRNLNAGTITLFLTKAATAPVTVAYFVIG